MGNSSSSNVNLSPDQFKDIIYGNIVYLYAAQKDKNVIFKNADDIDVDEITTEVNVLPVFEENYYDKHGAIIDIYVDNNVLNTHANLGRFMKFIKFSGLIKSPQKSKKSNINSSNNSVSEKTMMQSVRPITKRGHIKDPVKLPKNITNKMSKKIDNKINALTAVIYNEASSDNDSETTKVDVEYDQESI